MGNTPIVWFDGNSQGQQLDQHALMAGQLDFTISSGFLGFAMPHLGWFGVHASGLSDTPKNRWFDSGCICGCGLFWGDAAVYLWPFQMVKWPPTLWIKFGHGHWITKLNSTQFGVLGSLGKIDTARLPEFFAGSNLDQLKAQAAQGSGFCGNLRKEFPDLKRMASCELPAGSLSILLFYSQPVNFPVRWRHPNCVEEYSEVRCAVMDVLDVYLYFVDSCWLFARLQK